MVRSQPAREPDHLNVAWASFSSKRLERMRLR
jgi:hypothetical protein